MDLGAVLQARFSKTRQNCVKSAPEIADFGGEKLNTTGSRELKINTPNHRISGQSCPTFWLDFGGLLWHFSAKNLHFFRVFCILLFWSAKRRGQIDGFWGCSAARLPNKIRQNLLPKSQISGGKGLNAAYSRTQKINTRNRRISGQSCPNFGLDFWWACLASFLQKLCFSWFF